MCPPPPAVHGIKKLMERVSGLKMKRNTVHYNFAFARFIAKFSSKMGFGHFWGHWPDFRGQWLTYDLKFLHQSLHLITSNTFVFSAKL